MKPIALALLLTGTCAASIAGTLQFSSMPAGNTLPEGWKPYATSRHGPMADMRLVTDHGDTVLQITANHAAGAVEHALALPGATTMSWRWKVDHSIAAADMARKRGDDFAARVYVFFDLPRSDLSFGQRIKLSLARHFSGQNLPTAALCYVWDNRHPIGTQMPNPYYSGMHMIVLQSGNGNAGSWQTQRRDLAADFRAAFGRPAPAVTGIALGADTDNTNSRAQARFGDIQFSTKAPAPDARKNAS